MSYLCEYFRTGREGMFSIPELLAELNNPSIRNRKSEFHISIKSREFYEFRKELYSSTGNVVFADFNGVKEFAHLINTKREADIYPARRVSAATVHALGLIDEILHHVVRIYLDRHGEDILDDLLSRLENKPGPGRTETTFTMFTEEFPPAAVYRDGISPAEYLEGQSNGVSHREGALEELVILWVANKNPACKPFLDLFDDINLKKQSSYQEIISESYLYFNRLPGFGPENLNLIDLLRSPALASPDNLSGQLRYIRETWGEFLGEYLGKLLRGLDFLQEEEKPGFPPGPGPTRELSFAGLDGEHERFSEDTHWMPEVILMAKSTLVWFDQLSRQYGWTISRLDQIPDAELDVLAARGFSSLWLIGLWERSRASRLIKRTCGNPEAEASAYSLLNYEIAGELGGWQALENLRHRCRMRGIRLASDMVPNHTGIDSDWVLKHPEWYLRLSHSPYPSYRFDGQNLSPDPDVGIYLEDHYYDRSDAAVVFKRVDHPSGSETYIYHGNDGTSMPWNDTAQLDFLNPETREAVIQTILHVARNFSIIRFDAAMTLARKHIQRLWYPEPGSGGAIPSRSEHSLKAEDFHKAIPEEFWREVVDRIAAEVPDTLLLAEAFWMMEGYFVRTLGMHRVYNSAFMNMLKNEENGKYRNTIKNTLIFDPDILKRFVNFMNNPDEDTAAEQFGTGDKYIGVCTMMIAMPGLPMFGHGQIEGFREKYGMEYRRAYQNEAPDDELVKNHERFIFPLMHRRRMFAEVRNFLFFDFCSPGGGREGTSREGTNENVFAWFNRQGKDAAVAVYNNAYAQASGWVRDSVPFAVKKNGDRSVIARSLSAGLGLHNSSHYFCIFREQRSGLTFLRNCGELTNRGLYFHLQGYESQVYIDFTEIHDESGIYSRLEKELNGRGVVDMERARKELVLKPLHSAFQPLIDREGVSLVNRLLKREVRGEEFFSFYRFHYRNFLETCVQMGIGDIDQVDAAEHHFIELTERIISLSKDMYDSSSGRAVLSRRKNGYREYLRRGLSIMPEAPVLITGLLLSSPLGVLNRTDRGDSVAELVRETLLDEQFRSLFLTAGVPEPELYHVYRLLALLFSWSGWSRHEEMDPPSRSNRVFSSDSHTELLADLLSDAKTADFLRINWAEGVQWFHKESFQELTWWLYFLAAMDAAPETREKRFPMVEAFLMAEEQSDFRINRLLEALRER